MTKVFCEVCRRVFEEETHSSSCPHKKRDGEMVLAVRKDGQSAVVPVEQAKSFIAAKNPDGKPVELRLVVQRKDGAVPDKIVLTHGATLVAEDYKLRVHVPWLARARTWLAKLFRRSR